MVQKILAGINELRGQQRNLDKTGEMQAIRFDSSKRVRLFGAEVRWKHKRDWVCERSKVCETNEQRTNEVNLGCCWSTLISLVALRGRQERRDSKTSMQRKVTFEKSGMKTRR